MNERIDRALERQAYEAARTRELDVRAERAIATLRSFGITDFGPELDNLDIAAVIARNVAELERQQRLKAAAAEAATVEGQLAKEESVETKKGVAGARGSDSVALGAQATKVANTANETFEKDDNAQNCDPFDLSGLQQAHRDGPGSQAMKAEFDELLSPLRQSLGEVLDP